MASQQTSYSLSTTTIGALDVHNSTTLPYHRWMQHFSIKVTHMQDNMKKGTIQFEHCPTGLGWEAANRGRLAHFQVVHMNVQAMRLVWSMHCFCTYEIEARLIQFLLEDVHCCVHS
jgi:hypothetical protein